MEFIDKAIEKQRTRLGAAKEKQQGEEAEKRDQETREQVDQFISRSVLPVIRNAKSRFEQNGLKAEVDVETSMSLGTEIRYAKGVKLLLNKGLDRRSGVPIVIGPSLSFSASPPYSTTVAIMAYGADNEAIFSERFDIEEMTEEIVVVCLKQFVKEVFK